MQNGLMRVMLLAACCLALAACTAGATSSKAPHGSRRPSRPAVVILHRHGRLGGAGNPLMLSCADEAFPGQAKPGPADLVIGPLFIINGKLLATANPSGFGEHGRYKIPLALRPGSTATVTIGASARGGVFIDNPDSPVGGVTSASYRSCAHAGGFYAQGFRFTHGLVRGCVPLDVRIGHQSRVRHVTLSLFAGHCRVRGTELVPPTG